jgi:hypothetical protein
MKIVKKRYEHKLSDNIETPYDVNCEVVHYNLYIVYYVNCMINPNYFTWIENQLQFVVPYGGKIYLMCTIEEYNEVELKNKVHIRFPDADITIICNSINEYEYPGINKVWELSQEHNKSTDVIMYFHSKGITRCQTYNESINLLRGFHSHNCEEIIKDIERIYEIFSIFPAIDKITTTSGGVGWGWYNYWVARGSYLSKVEKPVKSSRRHYYEDWLARKLINPSINPSINENRDFSLYDATLNNCYQLFCEKHTGNIGYAMKLVHTERDGVLLYSY